MSWKTLWRESGKCEVSLIIMIMMIKIVMIVMMMMMVIQIVMMMMMTIKIMMTMMSWSRL